MENTPLPKEFREDVINRIRRHLEAGDSCALVGVGSSGKSNIARHLARHDVRLYHFPRSAPHTFVLYINCKPLAYHLPRDVYLEILDRLEREIEELDGPFTSVLSDVVALRQDAQSNPELLARRNLDRALSKITKAGAQHILVILDDCDDLFARVAPVLFSDLRGLRDNYKNILAYLLVTRIDPALLSGAREYEELFELLSTEGHTIPVTPYNRIDGQRMIERLIERQDASRSLSESDKRYIYDLSGGHAGLSRSIFYAIWSGSVVPDASGVERLARLADVEEECNKIWDSLLDDEQAMLIAFARREPIIESGLARLQRRGLMESNGRNLMIFSPVFERYVHTRAKMADPVVPVRIELTGPGQVRVNNRVIANLTLTEYELLQLLIQKQPQRCATVDLIAAMHRIERLAPIDRPTGDPNRRLQEYFVRLKAKLGVPGDSLIVPEQDGYRLVA